MARRRARDAVRDIRRPGRTREAMRDIRRARRVRTVAHMSGARASNLCAHVPMHTSSNGPATERRLFGHEKAAGTMADRTAHTLP